MRVTLAAEFVDPTLNLLAPLGGNAEQVADRGGRTRHSDVRDEVEPPGLERLADDVAREVTHVVLQKRHDAWSHAPADDQTVATVVFTVHRQQAALATTSRFERREPAAREGTVLGAIG